MESFEEFVAGQSSRLLRLAAAMSGNPHDTWDLVQETLVGLAERWDSGRIKDPPAYATTVMVRLNIDQLRRWRREMSTSVLPVMVYVEQPADAVPDWLVAGLRTLSPRQRTALALRFVEDLDVRQVAVRMRCSEGTVKSHLSRGVARLQRYAADLASAGRPVEARRQEQRGGP